jgi:hypothetical protein
MIRRDRGVLAPVEREDRKGAVGRVLGLGQGEVLLERGLLDRLETRIGVEFVPAEGGRDVRLVVGPPRRGSDGREPVGVSQADVPRPVAAHRVAREVDSALVDVEPLFGHRHGFEVVKSPEVLVVVVDWAAGTRRDHVDALLPAVRAARLIDGGDVRAVKREHESERPRGVGVGRLSDRELLDAPVVLGDERGLVLGFVAAPDAKRNLARVTLAARSDLGADRRVGRLDRERRRPGRLRFPTLAECLARTRRGHRHRGDRLGPGRLNVRRLRIRRDRPLGPDAGLDSPGLERRERRVDLHGLLDQQVAVGREREGPLDRLARGVCHADGGGSVGALAFSKVGQNRVLGRPPEGCQFVHLDRCSGRPERH